MGPGGFFCSGLKKILPTFWAERILILRIFVFWIFWGPKFLAWAPLGPSLGPPTFFWKKKHLRQRSQPFRASKNMGAIFLKKKGACGNVPTSSGLPEIWGAYGMIFRAMPCHFFSVPRFSVPCRANIFPCQYFPCRAVPRFSMP